MADSDPSERTEGIEGPFRIDNQKDRDLQSGSQLKACPTIEDRYAACGRSFASIVTYESDGTTAVIDYTRTTAGEIEKNGLNVPSNGNLKCLTMIGPTVEQNHGQEKSTSEDKQAQKRSRKYHVQNLNLQEGFGNDSQGGKVQEGETTPDTLLTRNAFER